MKSFYLFLKDAQNEGSLIFKENHPLSSVSAMGTGGRARLFILPYTAKSLILTVKEACRSGIYYRVIGNASNLIFSDSGFDGAIISTKKITLMSVREQTYIDGSPAKTVYAECGAMLPALSRLAAENALTGFEGLVSIPATVGGALSLNAGAFGQEISDCLTAFSVYMPKTDKIETCTPKTHPFSYRHSTVSDGEGVILSAFFTLKEGERSLVLRKMEENREKRRLSQPIGVKSVGSFFKRPDYTTLNKNVIPEFRGKSAGELIELSGLKGRTVGDAAVSKKHAGFIINTGKAETKDVLSLAETVKTEVYRKTGVILKEECIAVPPSTDKRQTP